MGYGLPYWKGATARLEKTASVHSAADPGPDRALREWKGQRWMGIGWDWNGSGGFGIRGWISVDGCFFGKFGGVLGCFGGGLAEGWWEYMVGEFAAKRGRREGGL